MPEPRMLVRRLRARPNRGQLRRRKAGDWTPLVLAIRLVTALTALTALSGCSREPGPHPAGLTAGISSGQAAASQPPPPRSVTIEDARAQLVTAKASSPSDPAALLELALFDLRVNDIRSAEQELVECAARFPAYGRAPMHLGLLYLRQGRDAEAIAPLQRAATLCRDDPRPHVYAALAYYHAAQIEEAKRSLADAVRISPETPDPYMLYARIYDHHGTTQLALQNLQKYLRYSPNPAPGYYLIGRINARMANRMEAELWLRKAVEVDPKNPTFLVTLGRIYYELFNKERSADAIECYQKALAAAPEYGDAHRYLGSVLLSMKKYEEAAGHLRAALPGSADQGPIYYDLGQALLKSGRLSEGKEAIDKYRKASEYSGGYAKLVRAAAASPKTPEGYAALARFCLSYRQFSAAAEAAKDGLRKAGSTTELERLFALAQSQRHGGALPPPQSHSDVNSLTDSDGDGK